MKQKAYTCRPCKGTGTIHRSDPTVSHSCPACDGNGIVWMPPVEGAECTFVEIKESSE
jgi:DnaJ-class molecular chaperone